MDDLGSLLKTFLGFVVCLAVAYGAWKLAIQSQREAMKKATATAEGTVLSTSISQDVDAEDGTTYRPVVRYRYTYEGETYTSDNLRPGPGYRKFTDRPTARSIAEKFPEGETTTVHLNPNKPSNAFLQKRGAGIGAYVFVAIPLLLALIVAGALVKRLVGLGT